MMESNRPHMLSAESSESDGAEFHARYAEVLEKARLQLEDRVARSPDDAEAWFNLGILSRDRTDYAAAERCFLRSLDIRPADTLTCVELGLLWRRRGDLDRAAEWYRKAVEITPGSLNAHFNLGNCARDSGRYEEAEAEYSFVLRLAPEHYGAWVNLGYVYEEQARHHEALQCYKRALELHPRLPGTYVNIGNLLKELNDIAGSIAAYQAALRLEPNSPEAHHSLGLALLASGNMAEGWEEYEWRLRCHVTGGRIGVRAFPRPLWNGSSLEGKTIFVYGEQGLGDNIQFVRFLPRLKQLGGRVIYGCYHHLLTLFERIPAADAIVDVNSAELPPFDSYVALMSIPHLLRIGETDLTVEGGYLEADPVRAQRWTWIRDNDALSVGLVWSSSTNNRHARLKSIPFEELGPLLSVEGVTFYSLQIMQNGKSPSGDNLVVLERDIGTLEETAAIIANLDLVISIDTSIAHLAGALGKEVWTFLPFSADWRWPRTGSVTPWYPTMTLYRQARMGRWEDPVREVAACLEGRKAKKSHERR